MEMNKMFGKLAAGMCRISANGKIAVKTNGGYKSYDVDSNRLVNCSNFVLPVGDDFFFVVPTNNVKKGDIILVDGRPRCVIKKDSDMITVMNFETSVVETIVPERHMFMGNMYFYSKIVSMFGDNLTKGKGTENMFKYMMMSEMMKGGDKGSSMMLPLMMMGGGGDMFSGMFDFNFDEGDSEDADA